MISRLVLIGSSLAGLAEALPRSSSRRGLQEEYVDIGAASLMVDQLSSSKAGYTTCVCCCF
jgi:hypothetical protein